MKSVRDAVKAIKIHPRNTREGKAQREAFFKRWGIRPDGFSYGVVLVSER